MPHGLSTRMTYRLTGPEGWPSLAAVLRCEVKQRVRRFESWPGSHLSYSWSKIIPGERRCDLLPLNRSRFHVRTWSQKESRSRSVTDGDSVHIWMPIEAASPVVKTY
jgi:hypothetical protein